MSEVAVLAVVSWPPNRSSVADSLMAWGHKKDTAVTSALSRARELVFTRGEGAPVQYLHAELLPVPGAAVYQLLQSVPVLGLFIRLLQLLPDVLLDLGVDEVSGF